MEYEIQQVKPIDFNLEFGFRDIIVQSDACHT